MSFNIESYFSDRSNETLIHYYKGCVGSDIVNHLLDSVEAKLVAAGDSLALRKRVYNVLIESLQNLYHHVDTVPTDYYERCDRFGALRVTRVDDGYKIVTGNFILSENIENLESRLKKINESSYEKVKELYKFILNHQKLSAKGGGGLGLVDIARKTGNKFEYSFVKYNDEYSFFYLEILVNEKKQ